MPNIAQWEPPSTSPSAKAAKAYLGFSSFSRAGLIQQLESKAGDGYTHAQAVYGVNQTGL